MNQDEYLQFLADHGGEGVYFEDWMDKCLHLLKPAIDRGDLDINKALYLAYTNGVRIAHFPLYQGQLDGYGLAEAYKGFDWWRDFIMLAADEHFDEAAVILVEHGILTAPCCGGIDPYCKTQAGINRLRASHN